MSLTREDIEYVLRDFLEVYYGTNAEENTHIIRSALLDEQSILFKPVQPLYGLILDKLTLLVAPSEVRLLPKYVHVLRQDTSGYTLYMHLPAKGVVV